MAANQVQAFEDADSIIASLAAVTIEDNHQRKGERNSLESPARQARESTPDEHLPLPLTNLEAESYKLLNPMAFPAIWEKVFLHLENFSDLLEMRLVCKTWRDYVDQWIMVPGKKKQFVQEQFVQQNLLRPWLSYSLKSPERSSARTLWNLHGAEDGFFQAIGDFCLLLYWGSSSESDERVTYECCVLHKGHYLGKVTFAHEPLVQGSSVGEILLLNKREVLIVIVLRHELPAVLVWRLQVTFKENNNQFSTLEVNRLNDHPLLKDMQILTLHDIVDDILVASLRTTDQMHQLIVTSLRYGWQKDMTMSMNSDWHLSKCRLWTFGWDGSLIFVPNAYLPGVCENIRAKGEVEVNRYHNCPQINLGFLEDYYNLNLSYKEVAVTENFICKRKSPEGLHEKEIIESFRISDGTLFCSTQMFFCPDAALVANNKDFAVFLVHGFYKQELESENFLVFSDREEMWFTFVPYEDGHAWQWRLIHNLLIVATKAPDGFNISVHDLEQRGKRVRTMSLIHPDDMLNHFVLVPMITTNMVYYVTVNGGIDCNFVLCEVVKCLELRTDDWQSDNGFDS